MARRLRFNGTGSGEGGCPALHEDLDSGEIIVHGTPLTEPEDVAQLRHLSPGEVAIVVPRALLVDFGPKEVVRVPRVVDLDAFGRLFENFEHTAWRLESRRRYASDEAADTYAQFLRGERPSWDFQTAWSTTIRHKTSGGATVGRVRVVDSRPTPGQRYLMAHAERLRLPAEDFWIVDSRLVAVLNFDGDDNLLDVELITEPAEVCRYAQVRDTAWHHAVPYETFGAQSAMEE
ncbi:DUF6879 family protein [Streptomyces erythrochromogenes]|uniref:DUF6879 family protein n=1 Tax=Streptomyces erythrochromogenes TaxID=285574 RepID=UPI0036F7F308